MLPPGALQQQQHRALLLVLAAFLLHECNKDRPSIPLRRIV
jgi:hypothetical protein